MTLFPPKPVHVFVCIIDYYTNSICNIYTAKIEAQQQIKKKKKFILILWNQKISWWLYFRGVRGYLSSTIEHPPRINKLGF